VGVAEAVAVSVDFEEDVLVEEAVEVSVGLEEVVEVEEAVAVSVDLAEVVAVEEAVAEAVLVPLVEKDGDTVEVSEGLAEAVA
jgi:hypothetical protein